MSPPLDKLDDANCFRRFINDGENLSSREQAEHPPNPSNHRTHRQEAETEERDNHHHPHQHDSALRAPAAPIMTFPFLPSTRNATEQEEQYGRVHDLPLSLFLPQNKNRTTDEHNDHHSCCSDDSTRRDSFNSILSILQCALDVAEAADESALEEVTEFLHMQ